MEPPQTKVQPISSTFQIDEQQQDESTKRLVVALKRLFFLAMFQVLAGCIHIVVASVEYVFLSLSDIRGLRIFPFSSWAPFWTGGMTISAGFIGMYASRQTPLITNICMKRWVFNHQIQSNISMGMSLMCLGYAISGIFRCGNEIGCTTAAQAAIIAASVAAGLQAVVNVTNFIVFYCYRLTYGISNNCCRPY
ncbi:uncharacterized protein LOC106173738 [Lingula anatina]|uniref:Uncharacterized protein LOC106173738 n=1 Tax=Lingula anatina TaxID=7574 RepID=A0A1S3JJ60_LINAN|nr:uncharacterized protein LOC106173738 [Lingula anatina]|eukprot:XP_013410422.1 uncharacterized protein LOC106173738 [Lingula anatina]